MRLHYYQFPESVDAHTRFLNGAENINGDCSEIARCSCRGCHYDFSGEGFRECGHFVSTESEDTISGLSITRAKQLLNEFGGSAWTYHIDRDGGVFETTEIKPKGNNSRHKYNRHL